MAALAHYSPFRYLRLRYLETEIVNQKNTIKSMIPQRLLDIVPTAIRDKWANRVVEKIKQNKPELYSAIGTWSFIPEEERETVIDAIVTAAEQIHWEIRNESK